ncbi:MAG TPA: cyclase family protein, partial [Anaeromyxobacteraceae bacterium]|nr:cyclase family protein [Anaeromyxobacteraceae bacterium]
QHRVQFDAEVTFQNGGRLAVEGFRLDIPGDDITDSDLAASFVRHLGLLMVGDVRISAKHVFREAHKGSRGVEARPAARRVVELSHPIRHGMVTYPGLPGPEITDHLTRESSRARYAPGTEFHIARISMVANTGTYLDAPSHRFAEGADLAATGLQSVADLAGIVLRVSGDAVRAVDRELLLPLEVRGRAVLVHTGWDRHFGTERYAKDAPFLTRRAAEWLAQEGAALVGIDSINIDDLADGTRPAHTVLLAAGIAVVEHLRGLEQLPPAGFRFHAAPPRVEGMGTFPVRAYAVIGA